MSAEESVPNHAETLSYIKQFLLECHEKCPELAHHADVIAFVKNVINPALVQARQETKVREHEQLLKAIQP